MTIVANITAENLDIAVNDGAVSKADAVKFLKARIANTPEGRKPKFPSLLLLCKLTGHDMSDTSRVALTAHVDGLAANAKAKPKAKAKAPDVPAQAAAMTTLPTPRTPKAPAKPEPKAEGTITVSQFEAIMTAMSNAAVAELRKQLG